MQYYNILKATVFAPDASVSYIDDVELQPWIEVEFKMAGDLGLFAPLEKDIFGPRDGAIYEALVTKPGVVPTKEGVELNVESVKSVDFPGNRFNVPTFNLTTGEPAKYEVLARSDVRGKVNGTVKTKYTKGSVMRVIDSLPVFCICDANGVPLAGKRDGEPAERVRQMLSDTTLFRMVVEEKADETPAVDETLGK